MDYIYQLIETYGIYIIFIVVGLEYACFPIPSEVVLPLAGAIGYINNINPIIIIILCTIAGIAGALFCYMLGYYGKTKIINKIVKNNDQEVNESKSFYSKHRNTSIFIGRLIPICRTYISFIAGANKHPFIKYVFYSTIGISIWNTILVLLGYYFYDNIDVIGPYYEKYKLVILSIVLLIIIYFIFKRLFKRKIEC